MKKFLLLVLICFLFIGCQAQPQKKPEQTKPKEKPVQVDVELANKAKEAALSVEGVEKTTTVVIDKNISTAIKVSGFKRLKLKSIKEEVHKKISQLNQEYEVHVTSDKKLFKELEEIEKKIESEKIKETKELQPKVEKINQDMKG